MIPLTVRAKDVIEIARREAMDLRHDHVGTEHVLLAILREGGGIAARLTEKLHLKVELIRKSVSMLNPVSPKPPATSPNQLPHSHRLRTALKLAEEEAGKLGHEGVGIAHLFLGLTGDEQGKAALILINLGLNLKETRADILQKLASPA